MDPLKWPLFLLCLCSKVIHTEASPWTIKVPSSVKGLLGSCVVVPCSFSYPDPQTTVTEFTGMWRDAASQFIYHPVEAKVMQKYRNRTKLLGDVSEKNCSLEIDPLQQSDQGPFNFRIEMADYEKFSYLHHTVSITITSEPSPISFSVKEEAVEGEAMFASCSVSHSCPTSPPVFTWSHSGGEHFQQQRLDNGQWKATSALTFQSTSSDHNKVLQCTVTYKGGQHHRKSKALKIKYAPVNVMVGHRSDIKEGDTVKLSCSSDANPPASRYEWHSESGAQLHQGNVYMLPNVSRHTGALYCTAINRIGRGKSSPAQLNVLYGPEIKTISSCSLETDMVKCMCIAESNPPGMLYYVLSDSVLPSTKVEKHGFVTIGTLQADLGSSKFVYCLANNTEGNATLRLILPVNNKMQNLYIAIGIGALLILVIVLFVVGVVKKCRGRSRDSATSQMSTMTANKDVVLPQYAATKRHEKTYDDLHCPGIYGNDPIYGNMETDWDDAIYANM